MRYGAGSQSSYKRFQAVVEYGRVAAAYVYPFTCIHFFSCLGEVDFACFYGRRVRSMSMAPIAATMDGSMGRLNGGAYWYEMVDEGHDAFR